MNTGSHINSSNILTLSAPQPGEPILQSKGFVVGYLFIVLSVITGSVTERADTT